MRLLDELRNRTANSDAYQANIRDEKYNHFMKKRSIYIEKVSDYIYQQTKKKCINAANEGKNVFSFYPYIIRRWSDVCSDKTQISFYYLSSWVSWKDKTVLPYNKYDGFEIFGKEDTDDKRDSCLDVADAQDIIDRISKKFDDDGLSYDIVFKKKKFLREFLNTTWKYEMYISVRW